MKEKIIISKNKKEQIKKEREQNPFSKTKFYTLQEFLNSYPYQKKEGIVEFIMDKYHVILEIAQIYLENITKYNLRPCNDPSVELLLQIKKELLENNLLIENRTLKNYLKTREVIFENIPEQKYLKELTKELPFVTFNKITSKQFTPQIFLLNTIDEEIAFIGEQIIKLIQSGILPQKIFLANIKEDYRIPLKRIFKMLNIPLNLKEATTLNSTTLGSRIIENIANLETFLSELKDEVKTEEEQELYEQILAICNKYIDSKHKKELIQYELRHTTKKQPKKKNCIQEIDFKTKEVQEDEYCFILDFNNESIPHIYKDEEFLRDKVRQVLNIDTSQDKNKQEKDSILKQIKNIKNCIITLKKRTLLKESYPSSLIEDLNIPPMLGTLSYTVSKKYNEYTLAKDLDKYTKFATITERLKLLNSNYKIPYHTYSNQFTKIAKEKIWKKLNQELNLSYTKVDNFKKCSFAYYINYVLKIVPFEDTFQRKLGNIIHKVLEATASENFDYNTVFDVEVKNYIFTAKEKFFLKKIKKDLTFTIDVLEERKKYTSLNSTVRETEFTREIPNEIPTTLKGIIDNLNFSKEKIVKIVDYKTGNTEIDASKMPLGFHLQLPTYLYLLSQDAFFRNYNIGGFYLQPLLPGHLKLEKNSSYEQTKQKALKMIGYSNKDKKILNAVDSSYKDSLQIKGLKTKLDESFMQNAKVFEKEDLNTLNKLVEKIITESTKQITNGEFWINPKIIDNKEDISCKYCPLKDLCYHEPKDNVYLLSDKTFLKEVSHGMDQRTTSSNLYEWN